MHSVCECRLATRGKSLVFAAQRKQGRERRFEGNFADYEEDKKRRLGLDSVIPHRLKYKKFSR